jgi:hypothetical protein
VVINRHHRQAHVYCRVYSAPHAAPTWPEFEFWFVAMPVDQLGRGFRTPLPKS